MCTGSSGPADGGVPMIQTSASSATTPVMRNPRFTPADCNGAVHGRVRHRGPPAPRSPGGGSGADPACVARVRVGPPTDSVSRRMSLRSALAHRNLLYLLSMKELRTRYRQSILGWTWSLLNPLSQMVIFTIIFLYVFVQEPPVGDPSGLKNFPLYFLSGLLPFQFFAISVTTAIASVAANESLIKKVAFPHEHLVFSIVIAQFATLLIELAVLSVALLIAGQMVLPWLPVMLLLMLILALFTTGVALAVASANVFFHDVNYLWTIAAQVLFYATPIIYVPDRITNDTLRAITNWGPTGSFVRASHEIMYDGRMPGLGRWAHVTIFAVVTFAIGTWIFARLSPRFAEEL
jgi:ABC-type polysaccharide/polyol phosphate export permease